MSAAHVLRCVHRRVSLLLLCAVAGASTAVDAATEPPRDGWAAWQVPIVTGAPGPCCHVTGVTTSEAGCDLDRDHGFTISDRDRPSLPGEALTVYAHFAQGRIDKMRAYRASCPVRNVQNVTQLTKSSQESLALLRGLIADPSRDALGHAAIAAAAYHADADATTLLEEFAGAADRSRQTREQATFWLGQLRGAEGADTVLRIAREDRDSRIREHAVFALSQSDAIDPHPALVSIARNDPDADVRARALFWIAQRQDARARSDIMAVLAQEQDPEAREQAVFALSQLESGAEEALIAIVRGQHPRKLKEQALFWLAQSDSDEAVQLFDAVLEEAAR